MRPSRLVRHGHITLGLLDIGAHLGQLLFGMALLLVQHFASARLASLMATSEARGVGGFGAVGLLALTSFPAR